MNIASGTPRAILSPFGKEKQKMGNALQNEDRLHARATLLVTIGTAVLRYGTVIILLIIGAQKWTAEEAAGIQPFTMNSPLFSWMYHLMSSQHASEVIGAIEL